LISQSETTNTANTASTHQRHPSHAFPWPKEEPPASFAASTTSQARDHSTEAASQSVETGKKQGALKKVASKAASLFTQFTSEDKSNISQDPSRKD
jgi:hypothetical protein